MQQQQQQQEYNPEKRMSVKPTQQPFLVVDGLQWDLSNLTIGIPSCEEIQQPEDPSSPLGSITSLSHVYDDCGLGEYSFASYPSPIQYPSLLEIPACLDVDDIFDKLRGAKLLKQGRLANPQLADLMRSRDKPSQLLRSETSSRPFQTRIAASSRTTSGVGLGVEQRPSRRDSWQSTDRSMQWMESHDDSSDSMEEMIRLDESFNRGHHQDEDYHRRRHQEGNHGEDPLQRMEEFKSGMRSRQDDDYHEQKKLDDSYHDRSSRRDDDFHRPTTSTTSSRGDDNYRRKYDHSDGSNDHKSSIRPSSRDRYRRDDDFHRSSFHDHPSPRSSQQQDGRNRREEDSRHRGAREDSYDEEGYRRQEDYHHRGGGSSSRDEHRRHNNNNDSRRPPPRDEYNSRRYYNDEQEQEDCSDEDDHQDQTLVEVMPGHFVPLRGSAETWAAVQSGRVQTATCFICMWHLACVDDADMVMCPNCRSISPVERGGGGGGLGLGMREEDASAELKRLEGKSRRVGRFDR